jgi:hypothetical protein
LAARTTCRQSTDVACRTAGDDDEVGDRWAHIDLAYRAP